MSVVLADLVTTSGRKPEDVLAGHDRFVLASIPVGLARSKQQLVVRLNIESEVAKLRRMTSFSVDASRLLTRRIEREKRRRLVRFRQSKKFVADTGQAGHQAWSRNRHRDSTPPTL